MLKNKDTGVYANVISKGGLFFAECSDGDHTHGHKTEEDLLKDLKNCGFEEI